MTTTFKCDLCGMHFGDSRELDEHSNREHGRPRRSGRPGENRIWRCEACFSEFNSEPDHGSTSAWLTNAKPENVR